MKRYTSNPAGRAKLRISGEVAQQVGAASPYDKFRKLTQQLVSVPKDEVNKGKEGQASR